MATISTYYIGTGKRFIADDDSYNIFGRDFNPRQSDIPAPSTYTKDSFKASGETSFDLSGFQNGNEVCFAVYVIQGTGFTVGDSVTIDMSFQKYTGGWQNAGWNDSFTISVLYVNWYYRGWHYVGIDYDEIRTDATQYRFLYTFSGGGATEQVTAPFTVSNLSFDAIRHNSGFMWVEGSNLCFIDASWSPTRGYKHKINYDGAYSGGTGTPGNIWIPKSTSDKHIYYVDSNGYVRRTNNSQARFNSNDYVGTNKAGFMWVSDGYYADDGYAHLCYIDSAGYKRRICNGGVQGLILN